MCNQKCPKQFSQKNEKILTPFQRISILLPHALKIVQSDHTEFKGSSSFEAAKTVL